MGKFELRQGVQLAQYFTVYRTAASKHPYGALTVTDKQYLGYRRLHE